MPASFVQGASPAALGVVAGGLLSAGVGTELGMAFGRTG